jgi:tetratricopeptide (TPR) repeat protein
MTGTEEKTGTEAATRVSIPVDEIVAAARDLARGGRWHRALGLLDAATATDAHARALLASAAAEAALECDWFGGTRAGNARLIAAERAGSVADLDSGSRWDLAFLRLRQEYFGRLFGASRFPPGPAGEHPDPAADLGDRADDLLRRAPDDVRRGWAEMYLGLIADNVSGRRDAASAHYEAALRAGEVGDDVLAREALRHLGDHDHDRGDHQLALERWRRATSLGARAGLVPGTLSQLVLVAVLARDSGDEAGAAALAREIARWAAALAAVRIEGQATAFLAGGDPTAPPETGERM